jgi:hypothetical protein
MGDRPRKSRGAATTLRLFSRLESAIARLADDAPLYTQLDLSWWQAHFDLVVTTALVAGLS